MISKSDKAGSETDSTFEVGVSSCANLATRGTTASRPADTAANEMVERVAAAIRASGIGVDMPGSPHRFVNVHDAARAAIEAMREPTRRMIDAALNPGEPS